MRNQTWILIGLVFFFALGWSGCEQSGTSEPQQAMATVEETDDSGDQEDKSKRPSPFKEISGQVGGAQISMTYSSPSVKGRKIFGGLEEYDKVWRTGANEATTINIDSEVNIEGQVLLPGKYSLFTIPKEEGPWTVIFNKEWDQWGAYEYDSSLDALRVEVMPETLTEKVERLLFEIDPEGEVVMSWDKVRLPIQVGTDG